MTRSVVVKSGKMEDLLDWLSRTRVISDSQRDKIYNAESPPQKLLDQLRNGLILVQLAQNLDKNLPKDTINVRPTTEILKESNFKNFLKACKSRRIPVPKPLKSFQGLDLQNFDHISEILYNVSKEIGRIDPKVKPLEYIPKIDQTQTAGLSQPDDIYESPYKVTVTSDVEAYYGNIEKVIKRDASKTGVENAFDELLAVESLYLTRLEVLSKVSDHFCNQELKGWFMDITHWALLLHRHHSEFKKRLDETLINTFCGLFSDYKPGFTYYGPLIIECERVKHKLKSMADLTPSDVRKTIEDAQKMLKKSEIPHHKILSSDELLSAPVVHIMRYLLMLKKFRDEAQKQQFDLMGLNQAIDAMQDINNFVDVYKHDTDNMEATRLAMKSIHFPQGKGYKKNGNPVELHRDFGRLMLDGRMQIAQNTSGKSAKVKYVMGFEFVIFVMSIPFSVAWKDMELTHEKSIYTKEIRSIEDDEKSLIRIFMQDGDNSFSIVETNQAKRLSIKNLLEKLCPKQSLVHQCGTNKHTRAPPRLVLGKDPDRTDLKSWLAFCHSPTCGRLLIGRITIGVQCCNCKKFYHEHCYYEGDFKSTNSSDETFEKISKKPARSFGIGKVGILDSSYKDYLKNNPQYPSGTFVIYCNQDKKKYVIAVKIKTEKKVLKIQKYAVCEDRQEFRLEGGTDKLNPFSSFEDLLNFYKRRFKLKENLKDLMEKEQRQLADVDDLSEDMFSDDSDTCQSSNSAASSPLEEKFVPRPSASRPKFRLKSKSESESEFDSDSESEDESKSESDLASKSDSDTDANEWEGYGVEELVQNVVGGDRAAKKIIAKESPGFFLITQNGTTNQFSICVAQKSKPVIKLSFRKTSTGFQTMSQPGVIYPTFSKLMLQLQTNAKIPLKPYFLTDIDNGPCFDTPQPQTRDSVENTSSDSKKQSFQSSLAKTLAERPNEGHTGARSKEMSQRYSRASYGRNSEGTLRKSSREEPTKFPFYVGKMDQVMAAQLLTNQNIGTYLLRKNVKGDYRISAKQELKIKHLILSRQGGLYKNGSKSYESISDLIEEYRTPGKRYHLLFPYKK